MHQWKKIVYILSRVPFTIIHSQVERDGWFRLEVEGAERRRSMKTQDKQMLPSADK